MLDITGGELHVANYIRLGTRGGEGTINQSGGTFTTTFAITIGWLSRDSVGTYNLDGGSVVTGYLDIGLQGTGYFNMTGGRVEAFGSSSSVGNGFTAGDGRYSPGLGVLNLSGGTFETAYLRVGGFEDSSGTVLVHGDAVLSAVKIAVGLDSSGSIIQSDGTIDVSQALYLGFNAEGVGEYTIEGGTFHSGSLYVGRVGAGKLTIVGSAAQIDIAGVYDQNEFSDLTVTLDGSVDHLATIQVGSTATFADGATLQIQLADGYTPSVDDSFVVLTAAQGVIDHGLQLVDGSLPPFASKDWTLDTSSGDSVTVIYEGLGVDLDGIPDADDNCVNDPNPSQRDTNGDGFGNLCDADYNNDGVVGVPDWFMLLQAFGSSVGDANYDPDIDSDGDGFIGTAEYLLMSRRFGLPPG